MEADAEDRHPLRNGSVDGEKNSASTSALEIQKTRVAMPPLYMTPLYMNGEVMVADVSESFARGSEILLMAA
ncbi:hypothetical protein [Acidisarcina polymorpha]|uniref:hypothetical protein n=1 Tax=Acidisarcina polymorpha TaxID=2211140 RepID=UPI000DEF6DE0|nr:hypothetical protein [Acidisarcina polymorpha]